MQLADNKVREFQSLYKKEFGILLSHEDAELKAKRLIELVAFLQQDLQIKKQ